MGPRMLLFGFDGSTASFEAIDDLRHAGLSLKGMAAVLSVADTGVVSDLDERAHATDRAGDRDALRALPMSELQREALDDAIALSLAGAERLRRRLPEWHVDAIVMTGRPVDSILHAARECNAELVVVGTHGRSGVERMILGSVSSGVAAGAYCSVRLGRSRAEFGESPPRIVVGVDRADAVRPTLHAVEVRDWPMGTAVHVVLGGSATWEDGQEIERETVTTVPVVVGAHARAETEELVRRGIGVTTRVVNGGFERHLIESAAIWGADLIVLGDRDPDADVRIAARARCSVEIVRPTTMRYGRPADDTTEPPAP